jgi:hypothetical protein
VEQGVELFAGCDALAGHAGIDLEVDGEWSGGAAVLQDCSGEPFHLLLLPDDGGEVVTEDGFGVLFEKAAHDEDSGLGFVRESGGGHCFAECCAFGNVGDS